MSLKFEILSAGGSTFSKQGRSSSQYSIQSHQKINDRLYEKHEQKKNKVKITLEELEILQKFKFKKIIHVNKHVTQSKMKISNNNLFGIYRPQFESVYKKVPAFRYYKTKSPEERIDEKKQRTFYTKSPDMTIDESNQGTFYKTKSPEPIIDETKQGNFFYLPNRFGQKNLEYLKSLSTQGFSKIKQTIETPYIIDFKKQQGRKSIIINDTNNESRFQYMPWPQISSKVPRIRDVSFKGQPRNTNYLQANISGVYYPKNYSLIEKRQDKGIINFKKQLGRMTQDPPKYTYDEFLSPNVSLSSIKVPNFEKMITRNQFTSV